jgi:general stress protein 26
MITTDTQSKKANQILENPKVEFLLLIPDDSGNTGYIRAKCVASLNEERSIRVELYEKVPHVSQLWKGPDDESLAIIELTPIEYDYMKPGDFNSTLILA